MQNLVQLKKIHPDWTETDLIEAAIDHFCWFEVYLLMINDVSTDVQS